MILPDTSGLLAALDGAQARHREAAASLHAATAPLAPSPVVLAGLDYLVGGRLGERAHLALLAEVERGAYALAPFSTNDVAAAGAVIRRHADLGINVADASIVVLAERHRTVDVLTLDERHFRVLQSSGHPFRLLPSDR